MEGVVLMEQALHFGENPRLNENYCITDFGKMPEKIAIYP